MCEMMLKSQFEGGRKGRGEVLGKALPKPGAKVEIANGRAPIHAVRILSKLLATVAILGHAEAGSYIAEPCLPYIVGGEVRS